MRKGALYGLCERCGFEGRCGIVTMNFDGTQLLPRIRVAECSIFFLNPKIAKAECEHERLMSYHDNSILCLDCHEIIWQDLHGKNYPDELAARFVKEPGKKA